LDIQHDTEKTNHIIETLPSVLRCSLARTKQIYEEIDRKISNEIPNGTSTGADYIANFPLILYCSVKLVQEKTLEQLLEIVRNLEERRDWRVRSMIDDNENNITDWKQYKEFKETLFS
jgi:hypothetical protein